MSRYFPCHFPPISIIPGAGTQRTWIFHAFKHVVGKFPKLVYYLVVDLTDSLLPYFFRLTMNDYTHIDLEEQAEAIGKLKGSISVFVSV